MFVTKRSLKVQWVGWCLVSLTLVSLAWLTIGCGGISLGSGRSKDQSIVYAPPEQQQSVENPEVAPTEEKPRDIETTPEPQPLKEFSLFFGVTRIYYPTNPTYQKSRNPYAEYVGQCTWYVFGRIQESEVGLPSFLQNYESLQRIFSNPNIQAKDWDDRIDREINNGTRLVGTRLEGLKLNIVVRSQPRPKSIAVWDYNNLSHVAFVESNGQITQSNYVLYDPKNCRYYLNPGEVVMRETVPILDDKGKEVGKAQQFHIMRVVKEETRKGKQGYILEPVPDGGNNLRGWAEWKEVVPNTIWNYTRIDRNPSPIWGDRNQIKYICLDVPDIPIQYGPRDKATNVSYTPVLSWSNVNKAKEYIVQVSTDSGFNSLIVNQIVTATMVRVNLKTDTIYWWRVKAKNENGESPWSSAPNYWRFITEVIKPTLLDPPNGATNIPTEPTLRWKDNNNDGKAKSYRVQVATNSNFSNASLVFDRIVATTSVRVSPALAKNYRYWWRVKVIGRNGESDWSDTWSFTTRK
jgi:hypothetical protein